VLGVDDEPLLLFILLPDVPAPVAPVPAAPLFDELLPLVFVPDVVAPVWLLLGLSSTGRLTTCGWPVVALGPVRFASLQPGNAKHAIARPPKTSDFIPSSLFV
jgi:hypothetical protein